MLPLWMARALAADCLAPSVAADISARLDAAEAGYIALDETRFVDSLDDAALVLPCVTDTITRDQSARYHRFEGLRLYTVGDKRTATLALRASRVIEPRYRFDDALLPKEHELRREYDALPLAEGTVATVARPKRGSLRFDGTATQARPTERATIFQLLDAEGKVLDTAYVYPGQPLPRYDAVPRTRNALLGASAGAVVLAGVFYGLAWGANAQFNDTTNTAITYDELKDLQGQTVAFTAVSGGLLAVAAGTGVAAFVVRER